MVQPPGGVVLIGALVGWFAASGQDAASGSSRCLGALVASGLWYLPAITPTEPAPPGSLTYHRTRTAPHDEHDDVAADRSGPWLHRPGEPATWRAPNGQVVAEGFVGGHVPAGAHRGRGAGAAADPRAIHSPDRERSGSHQSDVTGSPSTAGHGACRSLARSRLRLHTVEVAGSRPVSPTGKPQVSRPSGGGSFGARVATRSPRVPHCAPAPTLTAACSPAQEGGRRHAGPSAAAPERFVAVHGVRRHGPDKRKRFLRRTHPAALSKKEAGLAHAAFVLEVGAVMSHRRDADRQPGA